MQIYRIYTETINSNNNSNASNNNSSTDSKRLFYPLEKRNQLFDILQHGIGHGIKPTDSLVFYSDPVVAASACTSTVVDLLVCKVNVANVHAFHERVDPITDSVALTRLIPPPTSTPTFTEIKYKKKPRPGLQYVTSAAHGSCSVVQFIILAYTSTTVEMEEQVDAFWDSLISPPQLSPSSTSSSNALLQEMTSKAEEEIRLYNDRLARARDPELATKTQALESESNALENTVTSLRKQIQEERNAQEHLLRTYKPQKRMY